MDDMSRGRQARRASGPEKEHSRGASWRGGKGRQEVVKPFKQSKQGKEKEKEEEEEERKGEKEKEEGRKTGTGEEGGTFSWSEASERTDAPGWSLWRNGVGPLSRCEEGLSQGCKEEGWKIQKAMLEQSVFLQQQLQSVLEPRAHLSRDPEGPSHCEEVPRSIGLPIRGGDARSPDHSFRADVVTGGQWEHPAVGPPLLQNSLEVEDVRWHIARGHDIGLPLRLDLARSSSGSHGCGISEVEIPRAHQQRRRLPGEPAHRASPSRKRSSGLKPGEERGDSRSKRRDETSQPGRERRRLVEAGRMERIREGELAETRVQRQRREEGRQRRRSRTQRRKRRRESGEHKERREEEVMRYEAPVKESEDVDGLSWTPSPGESLDYDFGGYAVKERSDYDANTYSTSPLAGDFPKQGLLRSSQSEDASDDSTGRPRSEGLLQAEVEGLPLDAEVIEGGGDSSPNSGSVAALSVTSPESPVVGVSFKEFSCLISELWTLLPSMDLKHCKAQSMGKGLFPLPTVHSSSVDNLMKNFHVTGDVFFNLCKGLNSLAGCPLDAGRADVSDVQTETLTFLLKQAERLCGWEEKFEALDWDKFFRVKGVDYRGEEVMCARSIEWKHVAPALPQEVGAVDLCEVVELGTRYYVQHFEEFLIPEEDMVPMTPPRVMVPPEGWEEMASGLLSQGICGIIGEDEIYHVKGVPLLNGLFGVSKNEWNGSVEVHRLIMNLIPINRLVRGVEGDVSTLPGLSSFSPLWLDADEELVVSSEDVRCFFYIFRIPVAWQRFMAFNRPLPPSLCPRDGKKQRYFLCSRVLPMGFKNSVSIAQHIHRNVIRWAGRRGGMLGDSSSELRKDRPFSFANPLIRIYLDNYDQLERFDKHTAAMVAGRPSAETLAIRSEYESWGIPNHPKKSVCRLKHAEVQGALVDGELGIATPKREKVLKYLHLTYLLLKEGKASQRQAQVVGGGLVYLAMFRRPLLGCLNGIWKFIVELDKYPPVTKMTIPPVMVLELVRFLSLVPLCFMDFRVPLDGLATASDASTYGGGVTVSTGLTEYGRAAAVSTVRGDVLGTESHCQVLSIGLFDGIGALRVALDCLEVSSIGHISVETSPVASRVVEASFPGTLFYGDVTTITEREVSEWSCRFSQAALILIGAGPPCQGVSGLNSERKGALKDARSKLFKEVKRVKGLVRVYFPWAAIHLLMESVFSMDECDRTAMSSDIELLPWKIDAVGVSLARRPRLYWITWDLDSGEGVWLHPPATTDDSDYGTVDLEAEVDPRDYLTKGWTKTSCQPFPTFTTSRPRAVAGPRPAGVKSCTKEELKVWEEDKYRFPPYQYREVFRVRNSKGDMRLVDVNERECIMGFPVDYTSQCVVKAQRSGESYRDLRLTLLGNSWNVTVVVWLLGQLLHRLGLSDAVSPQRAVKLTSPGRGKKLQSLLLRPKLPGHRFEGAPRSSNLCLQLHRKLTGLVSIKGEDILLSSGSDIQVKHHRLRSSVPAKLWRWKAICGWKWTGATEHINCLELRAVLTTLRWRIEKMRQCHVKFIHLVDSQVVLHALARGRSSSRKLRRTLLRINSLLLATGSVGVWAYVHTSQNPADRPSRKPIRKKWVKAKNPM